MLKPRDPSAHVQRSPVKGIVVALVGGATAASAFHPATALTGEYAGVATVVLQASVGAGLALAGAASALWSATRAPPPQAPVAAHVAFQSRMRHDEDLRASQDFVRPASVAHAPSGDVESVDEVEQLALAIREVRQKMSKAKVMLGTGKLSNQGYQKYAGELKAELAELESQKMNAELLRTKG